IERHGLKGRVVDIGSFEGDSITRISLINEGPFNSAIVLGELTVGVMPTPGAAVLLGMGLLITLRRPRSRPPAPASAPKLNTLSNAALA
ncbi:MAG: hypothetical protein AAFP26_09140, partial [Planctomycetota bacterium]